MLGEHQASRRVNLAADSSTERQRAESYLLILLGDGYIQHIPQHLMRGLQRYREDHIPSGSFLEAVITGDLYQAINLADAYSLYALPSIVKYIDNFFPAAAYGTQGKYNKWISSK